MTLLDNINFDKGNNEIISDGFLLFGYRIVIPILHSQMKLYMVIIYVYIII